MKRGALNLRLGACVAAWLAAGPLQAAEEPPSGPSGADDYREKIATTVDTIVKARAADGSSSLDYSVAFKTGSMQYEQSGISERTAGSETEVSLQNGVNTTNGALEWEWFHKRDLATFMGYRLSYNSPVKRTQYQAGYGGVRYFLYTPGVPVDGWRNLTQVRYRPKFSPYVEGGLSLGRYLLNVFGKQAALDVSSEFYGVSGGIGTMIPVTAKSSLGVGAVYEVATGYGPILFRAQTLFVQLALTRYY